MSSIPLTDAPALAGAARATLAVRALLAAIAAGAVLAALLVARHPDTQALVPVDSHADNVLVLDVSASISSDTFSRIGATVGTLARGGGRFGLVVFSDQAYEALPPGTAAADLEPLVRYFTLPEQSQPGFAPTFPANPWQSTFSAGTKISSGLTLAHTIAVADRSRPARVVLVSDLDDDPADVNRLAAILLAYRRDHIPVRIVGLSPAPADAALFRRLLSPAPVITEAPALADRPARDHTSFPSTFVALALVAAAALATAELWAPRLEWGAAER
jgi:hypothetical protein